ncbi:MAG: metallophosphoesterase family protein [Gammaproteobacteria bacterium]|nr:MAG: metallophosphoesterase family protein [Gammaproteobacteria bacterium]
MNTFIGVISDTHGLVRPEAIEALRGSDLIIHAGDIGTPEVLDELNAIAPVFAVRGNVDRGAWANNLPVSDVVQAGAKSLYVLHDLDELDLDPLATNLHAVITGHSHRPMIREQDGVLYFNPGSAGPRRFTLPVAVGRLRVCDHGLEGEIIQLAC